MVEENETKPKDEQESEPEKPIIIPEPNDDWDDFLTEEAPPPKEKKKKKRS